MVRIANVNGRNLFHVRYINLSYRIRGRVHRIHTNNTAISIVFKIIEKVENELIDLPINKITVNKLINKILVYSAIKIKANIPLLYSVLNPETNSDSPSAKSNGVRLVSARFVVNQIIDIGNNISITHIEVLRDIDVKSIDCWAIRTVKRIRDIDTSYEMVWAIPRSDPRRAYLELEHHPDINVV